MPPQVAVTIGNFDGVHIGHQALLAHARALVGKAGRVVALAFDPHPLTALRPEAAPARLVTAQAKRELLLACGADQVDFLAPTPAVLDMSALDFIEHLHAQYAPAYIVEGPDFRFGKGRAGTLDLLRDQGSLRGWTVDIIPQREVALSDQLVARASSSLARWLIERGRVRDATTILGRPYRIDGTVVQGDQLGRTLGFPTINLQTQCLTPADGVYACIATIPTPTSTYPLRLPAALSVGRRPTLRGPVERRVEAHILNPDNHPIPGYNWQASLDVIAFLRDDLKLPSLKALVDQMHRDCARAEQLIQPLISNPAPSWGWTTTGAPA